MGDPPTRVTLLAGPTFLHINHLARPRKLSQGVTITAFVGAVLDNQITCRACDSTLKLLKLTRLGRVFSINELMSIKRHGKEEGEKPNCYPIKDGDADPFK